MLGVAVCLENRLTTALDLLLKVPSRDRQHQQVWGVYG